ncbi:MAG: type VI secretion system tube protein Hcp [Planctomycetes bacterium]|jgi:type VI secretion system secreted protein Hcp|nr:type VI secretion system tube protein Hcp [Planctomycetota bacterium]
MAFDCFMKIEGIDGECTDKAHDKWIEVLSFSHGLSQSSSGSVSSGGGRTAERCDHQDFSLCKTLDKASPKLALYCCNGEHIKTITIELCRASKDKQKYMQYVLSDSVVSSVRPGGSSQGEGTLPVEEVSFCYGKIEWIYTETAHDTGKAKGDVKAHWDLGTGTGG